MFVCQEWAGPWSTEGSAEVPDRSGRQEEPSCCVPLQRGASGHASYCQRGACFQNQNLLLRCIEQYVNDTEYFKNYYLEKSKFFTAYTYVSEALI